VQNNEPSEPVGSYLYRTSFTPEGSQTVTRLKTKGTGQQQHQVVVSDELIHQDLAQLPHLQLEGETSPETHGTQRASPQHAAEGIASNCNLLARAPRWVQENAMLACLP
jgi:hypothetical protein